MVEWRASTRLEPRYRKGTVVEARVLHLEPHGAIAQLADGTKGIIHTRELTWDQEPQHSREILSERQTIKVMIVGKDRSGTRLNLSLRQAERDPWKKIERLYKTGQEVCCRVVTLRHSGAFVELEPAVDAFLPLREACSPPPAKIDDILWVGDTVEGVITRIDNQQRHIEISIRQYLLNLKCRREASIQHESFESRQEPIATFAERLTEQQRQALLNFLITHRKAPLLAEESKAAPYAWLAERLPRILVADNDGGFRASLRHLLTQLGHTVETTDTAEKAVTLCAEKEFDLVLIDFSFVPGRMNGLQAARHIIAKWPHLPIVIITGVDLSDRRQITWSEARRAGTRTVLLKPVDLNSLYRAMRSIAEGHEEGEALERADLPAVEAAGMERASNLSLSHTSLHASIREELDHLQQQTGASACILFQMSHVNGQVQAFAHRGATLIGYEVHKYNLQASPVGEVIRLGKEICEPDTSHNPQRFQYLNLVNSSSFVGVPVKTFGPTEYGLFVFHPQKRHFTSEHVKQTNLAAKAIGVLLARVEAERVMEKVQPYVFAGQISTTLAHELNNRLGSVVNYAQTLAFLQEAIQVDPSQTLDPKVRNKMQSCIESLQDNSRKLEEITRVYKGLVGSERQELVNINEMIQRMVGVLRFTAEENLVLLLTHLEKDLPSTLAVPVWLEQIFVNVMLNAIQQIQIVKGGGELIISSRFAKHNANLPIQVRFTDTGPGIHGQHYERIFELGFSTRPGGTGLGLFTTRRLAEALGGRISVEQSVMLVGTTFLVEMPLLMPFVEGAER